MIHKEMPKLYTTQEIAEMLGVDRRTIYRYLVANKLKAVKFGRQWRVREADLRTFVQYGTEGKPEAEAEA